jgi:hypothetical protein
MAIGYVQHENAQKMEQYIRERQATWPSDPIEGEPLRNTGIYFVNWVKNQTVESFYCPDLDY